MILSVPDEYYSRIASCALSLISTLLLHVNMWNMRLDNGAKQKLCATEFKNNLIKWSKDK